MGKLRFHMVRVGGPIFSFPIQIPFGDRDLPSTATRHRCWNDNGDRGQDAAVSVTRTTRRRFETVRWSILIGLLAAAGCMPGSDTGVVVYTALDPEFSEPILHDFSRESGLPVLPKWDAESTKTVGLANAIVAEARRPRCDVFWNNEILNTLRLQEKGLLAAYRSPAAKPFPAQFRDRQGMWTGLAARARILLVNTQVVPAASRPTSIHDLANREWKGLVAMAKPLFGTTATHAACLFAVLGEERARTFFLDLKKNQIQILSGNKQVAMSVASGRLAFGLTDTDDALAMIDRGYPVAIVYPDRGKDELGTLFIPCTLAILKGCPHPAAARRLIDYLLGPTVEARLARGPSGQIPLSPAVTVESRLPSLRGVKAMEVDFAEAARHWDTAAAFLRDCF